MKIELKEITVRDLVADYLDNDEEGVYGYQGLLNIRPKYQREFIYKDQQRNAVIETIRKDFPLNVMYWVANTEGTYELLDGQQRTISICQYVHGVFSLKHQFFHNLEPEEQKQILSYKIMVYFCEGSNREKLDWFKTINIAEEKLSEQELKNAIYAGPWLTEAKKFFSKRNGPAFNLAGDYLRGSAIRQDYLETAIEWLASSEDKTIEDYMAENQHNTTANALTLYFQSVISWVKTMFPKYRKEMKGLPWGLLYNQHKDKNLDSKELEERVLTLMMDEEVQKKTGIYSYVLDGQEKSLNIRGFTDRQKREAYERQQGICPKCGQRFELEEMEADHITPWSKGGRTVADNCQMLCKHDNRIKSNV